MSDIYNLQRFIDAQDKDYDEAIRELNTGKKVSHWMWYFFPQIAGLGSSAIAQKYAISSLDEAKAYCENELLWQRLRIFTKLVLKIKGKTAEEIFGYPDYLKFRSSMTLFAQASESPDIFIDAIDKYYDGKMDQRTLHLLKHELQAF